MLPLIRKYLHVIRAYVDSIAIGFGVATIFTVAAVWLVNSVLSASPALHATAATEPAAIDRANHNRTVANATNINGSAGTSTAAANMAIMRKADWAFAIATASTPTGAAPLITRRAIERSSKVALLQWKPSRSQKVQARPELTHAAKASRIADASPAPVPRNAPAQPLKLRLERVNSAPPPLPRPRPAQVEKVRPPSHDALPRIAALLAEMPVVRPQAPSKSMPQLDLDSHTAVYDIAAHTVYMPNGDRLEAHSGLGYWLDNPRYVDVRDRGPTPPNVYELTLRKQLFHDVRAIRLNPIDRGRMFGRAGMLAHPYMMGANGQSNGCVSFRDYPAFLRAYLAGEVNRLIVVRHVDTATLQAARTRGVVGRLYADNTL